MYAVVQQVQLRKPNKYGEHREIVAAPHRFHPKDDPRGIRYDWEYAGERYERPIKTAYKISIHESTRVNGEVVKRQFSVATVNYYLLAAIDIRDYFEEVFNEKIDGIAENLGASYTDVLNLIVDKLTPLQQRIQPEFEKTEEYAVIKRHGQIIREYGHKKSQFAKDYNVHEEDYEFCYDIFGNVVNQEYLDKIIARSKTTKKEQNSGYYSNHGNPGAGYAIPPNLFNANADDEKKYRKEFIKVLAKAFHPDLNPDDEATKKMQLITKIKAEWGV